MATSFQSCAHSAGSYMSEPPESNGSRQSFDSERVSSPSPTKGLNGTVNGRNEDLSNMDPVERLQHELERTKEEKDTLAAQYRNLLSKLTTMRTTLGNKLKQDAVRTFNVIIASSSVTTFESHRKNSTVRNNSCNSLPFRMRTLLLLWRL